MSSVTNRRLFSIFFEQHRKQVWAKIGDTLQKSLVECNRVKILVALLFQTDLEAQRKGKLNANTLYQSVSAGCYKMFKWIFLVLDCLQPVGCFQQMIMTTHICITLGQKHNRVHSL